MNAIEALRRAKDSGGKLGARCPVWHRDIYVRYKEGAYWEGVYWDGFVWQNSDHASASFDDMLLPDWELVGLEDAR